jgi:RNA polymerase sigma factor (sigma-70 family)
MQEYIQNIIDDDQVAFEMVFKLNHKKIYAYFIKKTASTALADELTQLAFIKLWRFRHTLAIDISLDLQMFRIAKTTLLDHFRKAAREQRNLRSYYQDHFPDTTVTTSSYETNEQLSAILDRLPPTRRQVFILSRIEGYSYAEIAARLSISPRTVEKHISLALKQLGGYPGVTIIIFLAHHIS